jgi:methylenetetrahydrofolate dehydrogenase (NADP+)/methenyltetrahydrofolate cyclohydrolase
VAAKILSGEEIAAEIRASVEPELARLRRPPRVVAVSNRDNPASPIYLGMQRRTLRRHSIDLAVEEISSRTTEAELISLIGRLNDDPTVTGISVHFPVPETIDPLKVITAVRPEKDVEGTHPHNIGMIVFRDHHPVPCAAKAAVEFVLRSRPSLGGLEATVVGHSAMVGKPIASLLLQSKTEAPTVTVCHVATRDLAAHTRRADLLVVAVGKARLIRADMIKPGALVVDIGINREGGRIVGDVDFEPALAVAGAITPVPGGVGPVSLSMFLRNVVACAQGLSG